MPPAKIFFLLFRGAAAEVPMLPMTIAFPPIIINNLIVIPHVIVIVIAVVNPVTGFYTR
jgi:hypothetical protein